MIITAVTKFVVNSATISRTGLLLGSVLQLSNTSIRNRRKHSRYLYISSIEELLDTC